MKETMILKTLGVAVVLLALSVSSMAAITGTYYDASPTNVTCATNPFCVTDSGYEGDNLWTWETIGRADAQNGNLFRADMNSWGGENVPILKMTVNGIDMFKTYKVRVIHFSTNGQFSANAKIDGASDWTYMGEGTGDALDWGWRQTVIGEISGQSSLSVWIDDEFRYTQIDGIALEDITSTPPVIKGAYYDADTTNVTSEANPFYVLNGGTSEDGLWSYYTTLGVDAINGTCFEADMAYWGGEPGLPVIKMTVGGIDPSKGYKVRVIHWSLNGQWSANAKIDGAAAWTYMGSGTGDDLGYGWRQTVIGQIFGQSSLSVLLNNEYRFTRIDGIALEPISGTVSGKVVLSNYNAAGSLARRMATPVVIEFIKNGSVVATESMVLAADGSFTSSVAPGGTWELAFSASGFLRAVVTGVQIAGPGTTQVGTITLANNGDINGDNNINLSDYGIITGNYGKAGQ